ncbi:MAG TPA: hypothetical protein VH251_08215 [Verrucomicrobiae bacterium]|nr:hypothetical protein [Verrucomicrobiae bacterium]
MQQKSKLALLVLLTVLGFGLMRARATTFLQFQSTYLGDGWFQYQMNVLDDPFFTSVDVGAVMIFTNQINQSTTSTNWINSASDASTSTWSSTGDWPERPYQETFLIRSSETSYRLGTNFDGAIAILSLDLAELNPAYVTGVYSQNIVGYAWMSCLVPCTPDEADNSPTNYTFLLKLLPDVGINQLIQTNGSIYGLDFTWDYESTFLLQGSADMNNWTNVAYVWSYPPETTWTTNTPLNSFGNFFRISMVANEHSTNLPSLNSAATVTPRAIVAKNLVTKTAQGGAPTVTGCSFSNGKVLVNVNAQPGLTVKIQAVDSHLSVKQSQQVVTKDTVTTGSFDAASLPNPVYFQVALVP